MKIFAKKLCSMVLVLCVVLSAIVILPVSAATASTIQLGVPTTAVMDSDTYYCDMYFTPEEDGTYVFRADSAEDTYGYILDADGNELRRDDDGGAGNNFMIDYWMQAGVTYILRSRFYNDHAGEFTVTLSKFDVVGFSVNPISVIDFEDNKYTEAYYDEDLQQWLDYTRYNWSFNGWSLILADGTVFNQSGESSIYIGGNNYVIWYEDDNQSYHNQWQLGNSYEVDCYLDGTDFTSTVTVSIVESPIKAITVEPIEVIENCGGYWDDYWDEESQSWVDFYCYTSWYIGVPAKVEFNDGTVVDTYLDEGFYYNDEGYGFSASTNQGFIEQWTAGNTYTATVWVLGKKVEVPVSVIESPVKSITVDPISIVENNNGWWREYWDEESQSYVEYYEYDYWYQNVNARLEFNDGTVIDTRLDEEFCYNGQWYYFTKSTNQGFDCHWTVGNTYTATLSVLGKTVEVPVSIIESPIKSVTVDPINIQAGSNGHYSSYWSEELQQWEDYYYYEWTMLATVRITLNDGSVLVTSANDDIEIYGQNYSFSCGDQQYYEHWYEGGTYTATLYAMDQAIDVTVNITESPVKSITVNPVSIIEGSDGTWDSNWDDELGTYVEYYRYYWTGKAPVTVEFSDGTIINTTLGNSISYNGEWNYFNVRDRQPDNPWTVGNTYYVTASIWGKSVEVPVTIVASPIKSITVDPISIVENSNGWWREEWDEESQSDVEYYYYNDWYWNVEAKVEFNDGTVVDTYLNGGFDYNDYWYSFQMSTNQGLDEQWTAGNTYTATATILGKTVEIPVTITENPIQSISVAPITMQEHASYSRWSTDYGMFTLYSWWNENFPITVQFADGSTVTTTMDDGVYYGGEHYSFDYGDSQYVDNIWTPGNTYQETILLGGKSTTIDITIEKKSPYTSVEIVQVNPIRENQYSYISHDGRRIYNCPVIEYKVYFADGSSYTEYAGYDAPGTSGDSSATGGSTEAERYRGRLSYSILHESQYDTPWIAGNSYPLQVTIGTFEFDLEVEIVEVKDWEYTEQDGKLYITGCNLNDYEITVPGEIDGMPVVGIMSLGEAVNRAGVVNIPDSVTFISSEAFQSNWSIYTVNIGAGVQNLDADAFSYCYYLQQLNVSVDNQNYCSVDGIVYNKAGDTLVVYPVGRHETYYIPDSVTDVDVLFEKSYYSDVYYEFSENSKAFVVEDGVTYNKDKTVVIKCDPEKTGSYVMPDSVTTIKSYAFSCSQLSSVEVSDNVSELVYNTFSYCQNLETITLPDSLTAIGQAAFFESNLKNLTSLPNSLEVIGDNAFAGTDIHTMNIPSSVADIGNYAFKDSSLANLTLSEGLLGIYFGAFENTKIKSLTIPDSVEYIGGYAFANTPLESVKIGSGIYNIPYYAFADCYALSEITLPQNITYIAEGAFADAALSKVVFEAEEVFIGDAAFRGCPLDKTTLGDNIVSFGEYAFANNSMTSVVIPDSVTDITYYSFAFSENLENIDIPDTLTHVDGHAFDGTAWYNKQPEGVIYLEDVLLYYKGEITEDTDIVVKDGTTIIADYAFERGYDWWEEVITRDVSGLKSVTLPDSVKVIGDYAFYGCSGLEKIVIPASVETIGYAFVGCTNLTIYGEEGSYAQTYALVSGIPFVAIVEKQTDDVTISATTDVLDSNAQLVVDSVATEDITDKFEDATNIKAFDIYFELEGETVQPNGDVTVGIDVPDGFSGKYCTVYHIADDGTVTDMQAVYKDGKLVFTTNHFSVYVIVENKPDTETGDVNGDGAVNNKDLGVLMQYLNGWPVEITDDAADVNGDNSINNKDYGLLMQYVNGWPVELK